MEKSKNKRANNMLRLAIVLCIITVAVITVFTAASKWEEKPVTDSGVVDSTEQVSDTRQTPAESKNSEKSTEDTADSARDAAVVTDKTTNEDESVKSDGTDKKESKPTVVEEKESFELPVVGTVTKEYSIDTPVFSITMNDYRAHTGIDIACDIGSAVGASASGIVREIINDPMMGTSVTIEHADGICSRYMNLSENLPEDITVGAVVEKGQLIGAVGNTAIIEVASEPHLHFELTASDAYIDPFTLLDLSSVSVMSENIIE